MSELAGLNATEVVRRLSLERLREEGGWFRRVEEGESIDVHRKSWSTILALFTPQQFSAMHRLKVDEVWSFLAGDPLDAVLLDPNSGAERLLLGRDRMTLRVPAGTWQGARPDGDIGWSLVSCTCVPGFVWSDFQLGKAIDLVGRYPGKESLIHSLTRS